jgi:hypothetical protein
MRAHAIFRDAFGQRQASRPALRQPWNYTAREDPSTPGASSPTPLSVAAGDAHFWTVAPKRRPVAHIRSATAGMYCPHATTLSARVPGHTSWTRLRYVSADPLRRHAWCLTPRPPGRHSVNVSPQASTPADPVALLRDAGVINAPCACRW